MPSNDNEIQYHLSFPLPYRALLLIGLGIFGWASNLHGLDILGVDAVSAMDLRTDTYSSNSVMPVHHSTSFRHTKAAILYHSVYRIFFSYATACFFSWTIYRFVTQGDPLRVDAYGYIPGITAIALLLILLCPYNIMFLHERAKFTMAIRRCLFPAGSGAIYFSDVIFADIGTSFARVFGDIWLSLWMLKPGNSILVPPVEDYWSRWFFPLVMSFPFFLRFRQCLIEYNLPSNDSRKPLYNALKYATSFPVIFLSAAQRTLSTDMSKESENKISGGSWQGPHPLFRLWLLAAAVNSLYSFWWDVTNDWGLDLLKIERTKAVDRHIPRPLILPRLHSGTPLVNSRTSLDSQSSEDHPPVRIELSDPPKYRHRQSCFGLRTILFYPRAIYPVLIFVNLLLRMIWSVKLSTHMQSSRDGSVAFFWLEVAELVRRWLWVFVRVEWELIKKTHDKVPTSLSDERSGDEGEYEMIPNTPDVMGR
ncbi:Protein ERD1-like protein 1 [Psilocybe cubensis]|uniref:EXS domain-containing protein n=2 Tax=Psilocybe cubensis TaxID=181762 RepID=A0A8H8CP21_PSICU|nr:Protein ERD1-like protein 1 [Psilocybe cubensis]KAH9485107.1 Protein ERD1-like protein 1 [Psilocybe cubensis]